MPHWVLRVEGFLEKKMTGLKKKGNAVFLVGFALGLGVLAQLLVHQEDKADLWRQLLGWPCFAAAGYALLLAWRSQSAGVEQRQSALPAWTEAVGLALVLALALFMRLHRFGEIPNA